MNLVVIRSKDMDASKAFYEKLGLNFQLHQHGGGAEHYACEWPSFVFEIYPDNDTPSAGARVGFSRFRYRFNDRGFAGIWNCDRKRARGIAMGSESRGA